MKNKIQFILLCTLYFHTLLISQENKIYDQELSLAVEGGTLSGSLMHKSSDHPVPLAIFISGSGPTDRNGNQENLKTDCFSQLASQLLEQEISSLRFDKRYIGKSNSFDAPVEDVRFETFVSDIASWVRHFRNKSEFSKIIIIGHSLGSLMGMVAIQESEVDAFISIAGPSASLSETIYSQLNAQSPFLANGAKPILDSLSAGHMVKEVHPLLASLFPKSLQAYMISVFQYEPIDEMAKLNIPILIIQGTTDIQVSVEDAESLHNSNSSSELVLIEGMNHILKDAPLERSKNIETYNQPEIPINPEVADHISRFVHHLNP